MSYEIPTNNNPDVLRHWDFFKKALENTFKMGKLWDEFNITLREYEDGGVICPYKVFISGKIDESGLRKKSIFLNFLANEKNNSLYFKLSIVGNKKIIWSKRGKAFTNGENNSKLIFEVCDFLYSEFRKYYEIALKNKKNSIERDKKYSKIIDNMKDLSNNNLIERNKLNSGIIDLRIKDSEEHKFLQFYGTPNGESMKFNIDIKGATPEQAAKIARILAEE